MAVQLHVESHGSGPPLLILHGLFGSARNWHSIAAALAEDFHVHNVDLRNHGQSPEHPDMRYRDMADDLQQLIDSRGYRAVSVIGHSMGGKAAMQWALDRPASISRLIVVDIAPVTHERTYAPVIDALRALPLADLRRRVDAEEHLRTEIPDRQLRLFLLQNLRFHDGRASWRINLPFIRAALPHIMGAPEFEPTTIFSGPTQFLLGANSSTVLPAHRAVIQRHFPAARIDVIADAGHWPHADQPAAFLAAVRGFLSAH